eukprot:Skav210471  [mRNA]  locus=scaffold737:390169:414207:- [translate_table: standard]
MGAGLDWQAGGPCKPPGRRRVLGGDLRLPASRSATASKRRKDVDQGASGLAYMKSFENAVLAEYIWLDAKQVPRSKTMTMTTLPKSVEGLRIWNYDGSSTEQADGHNSEIYLYPKAIFKDPFRGAPHILVLAEAYNAWDGQPAIGNTRAECAKIMEKYSDMDPWFGIEQEYTLMRPGKVGEEPTVPLGTLIDPSLKWRGWAGYLSLLQELQATRVRADLQFLNASMVACSRNAAWQLALELPHFPGMARGDGFETDGFTTTAAISACVQGVQWQRALAHLAVGAAPVLLTSASTACAAAAVWPRALQLAAEAMRRCEDAKGDMCRIAALEACVAGRAWQKASALLQKISPVVAPHEPPLEFPTGSRLPSPDGPVDLSSFTATARRLAAAEVPRSVAIVRHWLRWKRVERRSL